VVGATSSVQIIFISSSSAARRSLKANGIQQPLAFVRCGSRMMPMKLHLESNCL